MADGELNETEKMDKMLWIMNVLIGMWDSLVTMLLISCIYNSIKEMFSLHPLSSFAGYCLRKWFVVDSKSIQRQEYSRIKGWACAVNVQIHFVVQRPDESFTSLAQGHDNSSTHPPTPLRHVNSEYIVLNTIRYMLNSVINCYCFSFSCFPSTFLHIWSSNVVFMLLSFSLWHPKQQKQPSNGWEANQIQ